MSPTFCGSIYFPPSQLSTRRDQHAAPPADILLSTFVDTSRPFQDCTDFSLHFRRIIIVIVSDIFTREHGGAFLAVQDSSIGDIVSQSLSE